MVLTNFELWAADGSSSSTLPLDFESSNPHTRHINPFDPRVVPQLNSNLNHLSSNGYYGFSYINAAHNDLELNNNNNDFSNINHNTSTTYNLTANDVNGINNTFTTSTTTALQTHGSSVNFDSAACVAVNAVNVPRCKKRFFVMNDDDCTATNNKINNSSNCEVSAKRCRFDDDFSAQYCNDFFQLPSTQIATQSCLMDTEEGLQQQQQHQQQENQTEQQQQQQEEPQQQHLYHQQQHYQGHLHRANRDVSRCMLSHMI